jgi:flagellar hook assembly protein FlgD
VVGVDGRVVREFPEATFAPGTHSFEWDGLDSDGRNVAPGVYFAVVRGPEGTKTTRLARLQ